MFSIRFDCILFGKFLNTSVKSVDLPFQFSLVFIWSYDNSNLIEWIKKHSVLYILEQIVKGLIEMNSSFIQSWQFYKIVVFFNYLFSLFNKDLFKIWFSVCCNFFGAVSPYWLPVHRLLYFFITLLAPIA